LRDRKSVKVDILVPLFREESGIEKFNLELSGAIKNLHYDYRVLYLIDKSNDQTSSKVVVMAQLDSRVKYLLFARQAGHQMALRAGFEFARRDAIVVSIDGDGQHPLELISKLVESVQEGFEVAQSKRVKSVDHRSMVRVVSKMYYRVFSALTGVKIESGITDFRAVSPNVSQYIRDKYSDSTPFLRGFVSSLGLPTKFILFQANDREFGKTNFTVKRLITFSVEAILSFSDVPLKLITRLGLIVSFFSILGGFIALFLSIVYGSNVPGYTSIFFSISLLSGLQIISIGVLGNYVRLVLSEVRVRPKFVIERTNL
jgi:polyisoprenyl-phosphate glycosyltransferase